MSNQVVQTGQRRDGRRLLALFLLSGLCLSCATPGVRPQFSSPSPGTQPRLAWWEIPECTGVEGAARAGSPTPPPPPADLLPGHSAARRDAPIQSDVDVDPKRAPATVLRPDRPRPSPGAWSTEEDSASARLSVPPIPQSPAQAASPALPPQAPAEIDVAIDSASPLVQLPGPDSEGLTPLDLAASLLQEPPAAVDVPPESIQAPLPSDPNPGDGPGSDPAGADGPALSRADGGTEVQGSVITGVLGAEGQRAEGQGVVGQDIPVNTETFPSVRPASGVVLQEGSTRLEYPKLHQTVQKLLGGRCPATISVQRMELENTRTDGGFLLDVPNAALIISAYEPDYYRADGFEVQLFIQVARLCLARASLQEGIPLSRNERSLRFLEEGFAHYLKTRAELASFGGQPTATRQFISYAAQIELRHHVDLDALWERLPDEPTYSDPNFPLHPRRQEGSLLAAGFVQDLIERQGLGLEGFIRLFEGVAANPFKQRGGSPSRIPRALLLPALSAFLAVASEGRISSLEKAWNDFSAHTLALQFTRPTTELWREGPLLLASFSTPMQPDRIDITLDGVQIGPERFLSGLGRWRDERTLELDLEAYQLQLGLKSLKRVEVNFGRIWQWFRGIDGIPAEGAMLDLSR